MSPALIARRCRQLGLSPIFLTDHDVIDGALSLAQSGVHTIVGEEIITSEGELIGLFLQRAVPKQLSPEETVAAIKEQGGLVYLEHPYDTTRRNLNERAIERIAESIDIVEVFNGRSTLEANRRAEDLRATLGVPGGAGSDAHTLGEIGGVYIKMAAFDGPMDFLAKLRGARTITRPTRWRRLHRVLSRRR